MSMPHKYEVTGNPLSPTISLKGKKKSFDWGRLHYFQTPFDIVYIAYDKQGDIINIGKYEFPQKLGETVENALDSICKFIDLCTLQSNLVDCNHQKLLECGSFIISIYE